MQYKLPVVLFFLCRIYLFWVLCANCQKKLC